MDWGSVGHNTPGVLEDSCLEKASSFYEKTSFLQTFVCLFKSTFWARSAKQTSSKVEEASRFYEKKSFFQIHLFLSFGARSAKPTSSKVEEERDASLCEEPVLNFSQSRTLRVWPLWEDEFDHMVADDNGKNVARK